MDEPARDIYNTTFCFFLFSFSNDHICLTWGGNFSSRRLKYGRLVFSESDCPIGRVRLVSMNFIVFYFLLDSAFTQRGSADMERTGDNSRWGTVGASGHISDEWYGSQFGTRKMATRKCRNHLGNPFGGRSALPTSIFDQSIVARKTNWRSRVGMRPRIAMRVLPCLSRFPYRNWLTISAAVWRWWTSGRMKPDENA